MKRLKATVLLLAAVMPTGVMAKQKPLARVEFFEGRPNRSYAALSPLSASKGSIDKAYERLRDKAAKMGADAVIDVKCVAGEKIRTGFLQIRMFGSDSVCQGMAVKWVSGVDTD